MLTGPQIGQFRDAITEAYTIAELEQSLLIRLEKKLENYAPVGGLKAKAFTLVKEANMEGWAEELIDALLADRPRSQPLLRFAVDIKQGLHLVDGNSQTPLDHNGLQAIITTDPRLNVAVFLQGLSDSRKTVCRIQVDADRGILFGTGFLVGPDLLMTNYHVVEDLVKDPSTVNNLRCLFDYEVTPDGVSINPGMQVGIAQNNPVLAFSPYSNFDTNGPAKIDDVEWPADCLDYALLRLEKSIGNDAFGLGAKNAQDAGPYEKRGWIKAYPYDNIAKGSHMIIIHHPDRKPLKMSIGFGGVQGCDKNNRRVRHRVNTQSGSSGSPCFDENFKLIALHNMGDTAWNPQYNQGIIMNRILADLDLKGIKLTP